MNLKERYSQESFLEYIGGDFLPGFSKDVRVVNIDDKYKTLKEAKFLGTSEELELSVFELKVNGSAEKKISQARDGFRIMKEYQVYRALMAYYSDEDQNWRFSLMQMTPDLNEKGKVITKISNPRRYSFYLGPDAKTKTAERFLKDKVKDFNDLLNRFNVEIVTKEFYQNYKKLFEKLLNYLKEDRAFRVFAEKHGLRLEIFAKKLLGQIVFIYFLQKKGWLGAKKGERISDGDKRFLRNLFDKCQQEKASFFNDYLEHLFYDCLNKMPERAVGSFYREKFDCQIPFLNGGLFEPVNDYDWKEEFINIPDEIFSAADESGILDIFDIYNFTIDENTPDDQEVSVDPEMLGKVFENLLEDNIRKGQGAFYTPREIVHYMCQESLINYLDSNSNIGRKTAEEYVKYFDPKEDVKMTVGWEEQMVELDKLIQNIKVCDPACGSGAFLVGMLNEIIKLRYLFRIFNPNLPKKTVYDLKKETIQNCLYGVDIDPGAVDIAKLRFWLSIVVDENIEDIEPLPNLDYKIMQGNSLLEDLVIGDSVIKFNFDGRKKIDGRTKEQKELFHTGGIQGKLLLEHSDTLAEKLEKYHTEYFSVTDPEKKKILKKKIDSIEDELIQSKCQEEIRSAESVAQNNTGDSKKILKSTEKVLAVKGVLDKWKKDHLRPFFPWKLHFSEVFNRENGGFDVVIANPPYVRQEEVKYKSVLQNSYEIYNSMADLYTYFYEKGVGLLRKSGVLTFITSNKFLRAKYGVLLRDYLKDNLTIKNIINFEDKHIFEAITNTLIFIATREKNKNSLFIFSNNIDISEKVSFLQDDLQSSEWTIEKPEIISLKKKIETQGTLLKNWDININYGLKTGYNDAFILDDITRRKLIEADKNCSVIIKPIIRGRDIKRYFYVNSGKYLILAHNGYQSKGDIKVEAIDINDYPSVKSHLDGYIKQLEKRQDKGLTIYNLRDCAFMEDFSNEKIIWLELTNENKFAYSDKEDYLLAGAFFMAGESLKYLLSFLNSKLCKFYFSLICNSSGMATIQWKKFALEKVPIIKLNKIQQEPFIDIVDKILEITKSENYLTSIEKQDAVREYEKQIDQMVYALYDLTPEEIKIVEGV